MTDDDLTSLHRYFYWALRFRQDFHRELASNPVPVTDLGAWLASPAGQYMSHWYASLYVVVEAFQESKLVDTRIQSLLESPNVGLLRRYRNAVYHYQRDYFSDKLIDLVSVGQESAAWIRAVSDELSRFLLDEMKRIKSTKSPAE